MEEEKKNELAKIVIKSHAFQPGRGIATFGQGFATNLLIKISLVIKSV